MIANDGALLTDLYQLTMLEGYFRQDMHATAVFECYCRELPGERNFILAAGLEQVLGYLTELRFSEAELEWLAATGRFGEAFLSWLGGFRFQGDVHAPPEGTVLFPNEPLIRITAPLPQAQLVESRIINLLHFQSLIAGKAARCVLAAPGRLLVDFGMRRSHGAEAALLAARASYLAGFAGTATVVAGARFGIPVFGTMAHAFVQAHDREAEAFLHFADAQPDNVVLLIDTYDTEGGARVVTRIAPQLRDKGISIRGVRLDSGDLAVHAHRVRAILDAGQLRDTTIFASGDLDEWRLRELAATAPIDGFGIGTKLDTSADAPYMNCAYKLQEYDGRPRRKHSEGKTTWPGRKQIYRQFDAEGRMLHDTVGLEDEDCPGEPLLRQYMQGGQLLPGALSLPQLRERTAGELRKLSAELRHLERCRPYPVSFSPGLVALGAAADAGEEDRP